MLTTLDFNTINLIEKEYLLSQNIPWFLGFSGGKDSSAMLKLTYNAIAHIRNPKKMIKVVFCDTGVEIPTISAFVKKTFDELENEIKELNLPIKFNIVEPKIKDRFFSKVIGHGYPTPTNKFRWCTDRLRINPIKEMMNNKKENIILVGVRKGESIERDKIIKRHKSKNPYYFEQAGFKNIKLFAPILEYNIQDVWSIIKSKHKPKSINSRELEVFYNEEARRFGCWTCTVVREDRAVKDLINNGYENLKPLLQFRNWIYHLRDNKNYRCKYRRNGMKGLGPFTIEARQLILKELLKTQHISGYQLIKNEEITYIKAQWALDIKSFSYREN